MKIGDFVTITSDAIGHADGELDFYVDRNFFIKNINHISGHIQLADLKDTFVILPNETKFIKTLATSEQILELVRSDLTFKKNYEIIMGITAKKQKKAPRDHNHPLTKMFKY
jgi:hypothetical protein